MPDPLSPNTLYLTDGQGRISCRQVIQTKEQAEIVGKAFADIYQPQEAGHDPLCFGTCCMPCPRPEFPAGAMPVQK